MVVEASLCWTWSETQKTGFLTTRLILFYIHLASPIQDIGPYPAEEIRCVFDDNLSDNFAYFFIITYVVGAH